MISILLCTYNGGVYLSEQLDSLLNQTFTDYQVFIHDDGSTDETINIIQSYCNRYSNIHYLEDNVKHRGARHSFMWLLENVDSKYYMFCDQDDVWLPNKLELMYGAIKKAELTSDKNKPVLVHSDMKIVDRNLNVISNSLYRTMRIIPRVVDNSFNFMGVCSCGPGCSMIFNNVAKLCALSYDDLTVIPMHDWWIAINTIKHGKVKFLDMPTMLYRQHDNNTVGASDVTGSYMLKKLRQLRKTLSQYPEEISWLKKVNYGGILKYLYFKFLYSIIRLVVKFGKYEN